MAETLWSLRIYATVDGRRPFSEWLDSLKDERGRDRIEARLSRIEFGNFGDCRAIGEGLSELRVDFGPGYRVYFRRVGHQVILLLCGGPKGTQNKDIALAKAYWKDYRSRTNAYKRLIR